MSYRFVLSSLTAMVVSTSSLAGDLNPPAGPVAATMKDLVDVEPRTAVNAINTPGDASNTYIITDPGSYYLTENLIGSANDTGISVRAQDVTLDLNGFVVQGPGATGNFERGVVAFSIATNFVLRNGSVVGWDSDGVLLVTTLNDRSSVEDITVRDCGEHGIEAKRSSYITRCFVQNCGSTGIFLSFEGAIVTDCIAVSNGGSGFAVFEDAIFERCLASDNQREGFRGQDKVVYRACVASNNIQDGFKAFENCRTIDCVSVSNGISGYDFDDFQGPHISTGCMALENTGTGFLLRNDVVLTDCSAYRNGGPGFDTQSGATITNCNAGDNSDAGYFVGDRCKISGSVARSNNGIGIVIGRGSVIDHCVADLNGLNGVSAGTFCRVVDCSAEGNLVDGIRCGNDSSVFGCVVAGNGGDGINAAFASVVQSCSAIDSGNDGIVVGSQGQILACLSRASDADGLQVGSGGSVLDSVSTFNLVGLRLTDKCLVSRCTTYGNTNFGIYAGSYNRIHECICSDDGDTTAGAGIRVVFGCVVADNTLQSNGDGVRLDNARNAVIRNTFIHNTVHINDVPGTNTLPANGSAATAINNDNIYH